MRIAIRPFLVLVGVLAWVLVCPPSRDLSAAPAAGSTQTVRFNRDIRPILAETCFLCHGPNENTRQADLRLDTRDFVGALVVPNDSAGSILFQRLIAEDDHKRMPPAASGLFLTQGQIDAVRRWIDAGAEWESDAATLEPTAVEIADRVVNFDREVRPILSENCFTCHGPDEQKRQRGLRLDVKEGPFGDRGHFGGPIVVPGSFARSLLHRRITSEDASERMPWGREALTDDQIEIIRLWIDQGAEWKTHWSFIPPRRPALPPVQNRDWPRNPIDYFVLARLERDGLSPSPEADRATLIRRVTRDLTGLPPTPAEVNAFLGDDVPNAYEELVDRLLQSPRYGERMAVEWLDAARYADTSGYQSDAERHMWRWRDWVIDAYNANTPFDQFTIEQIAGDMLPDASLEQEIATGFNRNHSQNGEGGIIPEEYLVENVVDRVETTSTVWLGLTMGCARCHDHKFDPITQKEFYQVFAHFNNIPERGKAFKQGNSPPFVKAPTADQQAQLAELDSELRAAEQEFSGLESETTAAQKRWEESLLASARVDWVLRDQLVARYPFNGDIVGLHTGKRVNPRLEDGHPHFVSGRLGAAAGFDGKRFIDAGDVANFGYDDKFTLAAWIYPRAPDGVIVSRAREGEEGEQGYGLYLNGGRVQINLSERWLDDGVRVQTQDALPLNEWRHVLVTYDGSRIPTGFRIYVNGRSQALTHLLDGMNNPIQMDEPLRIGASGAPRPRFQGHIDDVRIYEASLTPGQAAVVSTAESVSEIARLAPEKRTQAQSDKVRLCFLDQYAPQHIRQAWRRLVELKRQREQLWDSFPTVMVMQENEPRRDTFRLIRGAYDSPGEKVSPGVPAILPPLPESQERNRLTFARWLVDPSNPLPARVTVNRFWQMYFGRGLVKTSEDFGVQGERPTHPELLDWLATTFISSGWDVKAMQRTIVTSATYRQSSKVTPALLKKDPDNRLLARGPRFRLPAPMIRDQALAIAGLLVEKIGGPSVKPYQPPGLWTELAGQDYQQDHGEDLYRRSLYTFWKRTAAPPSMVTFDSATRETCIVRQTRTNTPLQALNLMNDVTYVEASRMVAERMIAEGGTTPEQRVSFAYHLATAREPEPEEEKVLIDGFYHHLDRYRSDRMAALKLVSEGEYPRNQALDVAELASYTILASLILNLDETLTKE